jgi:hypothetical protein
MHWERADNVADEKKSFKAGIDFPSVLRIISKQIYETPLAFNRENVQNAVDAVRIQAYRDQKQSSDAGYRIDITVEDRVIRVRDNGTGMWADDLRKFFLDDRGKRQENAGSARRRLRRYVRHRRLCKLWRVRSPGRHFTNRRRC